MPYESIAKALGRNGGSHILCYSAETLYYMFSVFMFCVELPFLSVMTHTPLNTLGGTATHMHWHTALHTPFLLCLK